MHTLHDKRLAHPCLLNHEPVNIKIMVILGIRHRRLQCLMYGNGDAFF